MDNISHIPDLEQAVENRLFSVLCLESADFFLILISGSFEQQNN